MSSATSVRAENPASVTFVVPHKGREAFLRDTLRSIAGQQGDHHIQVVVVTQNPSLEPTTLSAASGLPLHVDYAPAELTIAALRNRGVQQTDSDYLAFLDADIALSADWLSATLAHLRRQDVVLASAKQIAADNPPLLELIRVCLSNATVDAPVDFLPGRNLLLRRHTFDEVGGFPEHLVTCEDYYFTHQVGKLGQLWYGSDAYYVHLGEDKQLSEMFRKEIWRGQSNLQSLHGRRVEPGEWPSFIVPPWIVLCAIAVPLSLLFAQPQLAAIAGAGALLPFAAYVTRLYLLAAGQIGIGHIAAFYGYYFLARAWGTVLGAFKTLGKRLHDY